MAVASERSPSTAFGRGLMATVLYAFAVLAGAGLIASAVVHALSLAGTVFPITLPDSVFALHVGIFIVGFPTILVSNKITERYFKNGLLERISGRSRCAEHQNG